MVSKKTQQHRQCAPFARQILTIGCGVVVPAPKTLEQLDHRSNGLSGRNSPVYVEVNLALLTNSTTAFTDTSEFDLIETGKTSIAGVNELKEVSV